MSACMTARAAVGGMLLALTLSVTVTSFARAQSDELIINDVNDDEYPTVEVAITVPEELRDLRLSKEPFSITEDGRTTQPYLGTSETSDEPPPAPRIVLAIDVSTSMAGSIDRAKAAADTFVESLPDGSQVAVVTFGNSTNVLISSTENLNAVRSSIASIDVAPNTNTALYAGVRRAASLVTPDATGTSSVVVLSDGEDTVGSVSEDAAIAAVQESDATLWAVELASDQQDHEALVALAGDEDRVLAAANADALEGVYRDLASDLSREYVLRYESEANGETSITVALDYETMRAERTQQVAIDGSATPERDPVAQSKVRAETFVVTVPLLGTVAAGIVGGTAFVIGTLILILIVLLPRPPRPGERLVVYHEQTDGATARLSALAQWTTEATDRRIRKGDLGARLDRALEGAGVNLRPGELVVMLMSSTVIVFALGVLGGNALLGLFLAALLPLGAKLWLSVRRDRRQAAFADQLTDVLLLVSSSLRAGYGLTQGIDAVSRDADEPAASEFRRIIIEHRLGRDLDEAMENCATRMDNDDFKWVVQAISIHRDVGGDLAKVLDNIVATVRDRADVLREVRSLSAEGRMSARVLVALPFLVLAMMQLTNAQYMSTLISEPIGLVLLAAAALLMLTGVLVIRRMVKIQY